jgi:hypothetical protein
MQEKGEKAMKNFEKPSKSEERIAMFSDAHMYESQDPLHKELKGKNTRGEKMIAKAIKEGEKKFALTLEEAEKIGDIDFFFFGGDMVTGYGERGLTGPDSPEHISKFKGVLDKHFKGAARSYMAGGHEVGYILPLSTDPEGGPSEKSIEIFEGNFNELFYTFSKGRYKFVVLSSDLELLKDGRTDALMKKKKRQGEFYRDEITYTKPDQKIVLMLHDPDALAPMASFLEQELEKIEKTFSGHLHAQWVKSIYPTLCKTASSRILSLPLKPLFNKMFPGKADAVWEYFSNNKGNAKIWKSVKLSVIPAPGGMMGIGGGFLVADLKEDGIEVQKVKTPKLKKEDA